VCDFYSIYVTNKCGHGSQVGDPWRIGFVRWLFEDDISNAMCGKMILGSLRTERQQATVVLGPVR